MTRGTCTPGLPACNKCTSAQFLCPGRAQNEFAFPLRAGILPLSFILLVCPHHCYPGVQPLPIMHAAIFELLCEAQSSVLRACCMLTDATPSKAVASLAPAPCSV